MNKAKWWWLGAGLVVVALVAATVFGSPSWPKANKPFIGPPQVIRVYGGVPAPRLAAVAFADLRHGWAGGAGIILGTTDGGGRWQRQYSGGETFSQIQALSPTDAFAVGQGRLLGTSDGGRTWHALGEPRSQSLSRVDFLTPTSGFGLAGPQGSLNLSVFRTTDGGRTWQMLPLSSTSICFVSAQRGWAVGNGVEETTDSGVTWQKSTLILPANQMGEIMANGLGCAAPDTLYVQLTNEGGGMSQLPYSIYVSHDGGETWHPVAVTPPGAVGSGPGYQQGIPAPPGSSPGPFQVVDSQTMVAAGVCTACQFYGTTMLGQTGDGGRTWQNAGAWLPAVANGIAFPTAQTGWAVGSLRWTPLSRQIVNDFIVTQPPSITGK